MVFPTLLSYKKSTKNSRLNHCEVVESFGDDGLGLLHPVRLNLSTMEQGFLLLSAKHFLARNPPAAENGDIWRSRIGMTVALRMSGKLLRVSGACDTYSKFATARKMTNTLCRLAFSGPATVMPNPTKPMSPFSRHYTFQKTKKTRAGQRHIVP